MSSTIWRVVNWLVKVESLMHQQCDCVGLSWLRVRRRFLDAYLSSLHPFQACSYVPNAQLHIHLDKFRATSKVNCRKIIDIDLKAKRTSQRQSNQASIVNSTSSILCPNSMDSLRPGRTLLFAGRFARVGRRLPNVFGRVVMLQLMPETCFWYMTVKYLAGQLFPAQCSMEFSLAKCAVFAGSPIHPASHYFQPTQHSTLLAIVVSVL